MSEDDLSKKIDELSLKPEAELDNEEVGQEDGDVTKDDDVVVSAERACEIIREAAEEAVKSDDYISYATVLDEHLHDVEAHSIDERVKIISTLHDVLDKNRQLVHEIGWDLPELLLPYFDTDFTRGGGLRSAPGVTTLIEVFNLLATDGNAKEVFLKSVEAMATLDWIDEETESDRINHAHERAFDLKFFALYTCMFSTIQRINAQYPSRFLATSTSALLSLLARNMEDVTPMSLAVLLRRMYTFARDFATEEPAAPVAESEVVAIRKLLQSYVTWVPDLAFQRFSVRWSTRLYLEMKHGKEMDDAKDRAKLYEADTDMEGIAQCTDRLAELLQSFDVDLDALFAEFLTQATEESEKPEEQEQSIDADNLFRGFSDDGLLLLYTQLSSERRQLSEVLTFEQVVNLAKRFLQRDDGALAPYGVIDAVVYWSLWTTRTVTTAQIKAVDKKDFTLFLQLLSVISAAAIDRQSAVIVNSIICKLLTLQDESISFDYLVDTLRECPFENLRDSTIHMLKNFAIRRRPVIAGTQQHKHEDDGDLAAKLDRVTLEDSPKLETNCPIIHLKKGGDRLKSIADLALSNIEKVAKSEDGIYDEAFPVVLSWLNFFTVVETSPEYIKEVVRVSKSLEQKKVEHEGDTEGGEARRKQLLALAVERLEKRWSADDTKETKKES